MPKIQEYIDQRQIQPGRSIARSGTTAVADSVKNLGNTIEGIGQKIQEREDRLNYVKAKSDFNQRKIAADNAFYDDQDYKTFIPRYSEEMKKARQETVNAIRNPFMKAEFEAQADLDIEHGLQRTAQLAWVKEKEFGRGQLTGMMDRNREAFLNAASEQSRASIIRNDLEAINTTQELGYIKPDEAEKLRIDRTRDLAKAYLDTKAPSERLQLLQEKGGYAEYIPSDERKAMEDKTKAQLASQQLLMERQRKLESSRNHINVLSSIESNGGVIDVPSDVWNSFDSGQRNSAIEYSKKVAGGDLIVTDWNRYYDLIKAAQTDPAAFTQMDLGLERNNLGNAEYKEIIKMQSSIVDDKSKSGLVFNVLSDKAAIDNALYQSIKKKPSNYNDDDYIFANAFYRIANEEMQQWLLENPNYKKVPDDSRQQIIDKLTEQMNTRRSFFGIDMLWPDTESSLIEEIISDLEDSGEPVTSYSIFRTYQNAKRAGIID